ncbi:unnamed protein product, partial [Oncorhynchus mykiss]
SKRKVLGRRNSEEDRCRVFPLSSSSSFSSTPPVRGHRLGVSSSSDSFKALLLRKGSRCDPVARMSAAERLRMESHTHTPQPFAQTHTVQLMTLHLPQSQSTHRHRRRAEWALTEGTLPLSSLSSPTYPSPSPSLWGWRPPRSRTPPCSASRRFAARSRLPSSPMTAISEREGEGESMEGNGLAVTCDSCKTFGLIKLTDGRAEATNGSLDWQQSRSMETHTVLWIG